MLAPALRRGLALGALLAVLLMPYESFSAGGTSGQAAESGTNRPAASNISPVSSDLPDYPTWKGMTADKASDAPSSTDRIVLAGGDYAAVSDPAAVTRTADAIEWHGKDSWIEYEVTVPQEGLYHIGLVYDTAGISSWDMIRGVMVNGEYPYAEAEYITLKREFTQQLGDDGALTRTEEVHGWKEALFSNFEADVLPLRWHLKPGANRIRLTSSTDDRLVIGQLIVAPPERPETYEQASAAYPQPDPNDDWIEIRKAVDYRVKSNNSISANNLDKSNITLGGPQFDQPGQYVEWKFSVPKDGRYRIGFKYVNRVSNMYVRRAVTLDGKMPFSELQDVRFEPDANWRWKSLTLSDDGGQAMLFDLKAGEHTLRMTVVSAAVRPVVDGLRYTMRTVQDLDQKVRKATGLIDRSGANADTSRDWQIEKNIPDVRQQLQGIIDRLQESADQLKRISPPGKNGTELDSMGKAIEDLAELRDRPESIPNKLAVLGQLMNDVSSWSANLTSQPLELDTFWVAGAGAPDPDVNSGFWGTAKQIWNGFIRSFSASSPDRPGDGGRQPSEPLRVWLSGLPRQNLTILQKLADEQFTPQTGIRVNVELVPVPNKFIYSNLAGNPPDVGLGLDEHQPVEFGMRGGLADLSGFEGFRQTIAAFNPASLVPFEYDGRVYGLPQNQDFRLLAYRTDILDRLGIAPPETWDDLIRILPALQQNGYNFYAQYDNYLTFFFQNDAEIFTADGLKSGLSSKEAVQGFKQWTELMNLYQLPVQLADMSFYNQFRTGVIPIGMISMQEYSQIAFAAPELTGRWKLVHMPGNKREDGTIARWADAKASSAVIFEKSKRKEDAWKFLQWWMSADTQRQYMIDMEANFGSHYRWNSANIHAYEGSPWPQDVVAPLMEQWKWIKNAPNVPGGYITDREIRFAYQNAVVGTQNPRESLNQAVQHINQEMERKQREFGLRDHEGQVLKTLTVPRITQPWEGISP